MTRPAPAATVPRRTAARARPLPSGHRRLPSLGLWSWPPRSRRGRPARRRDVHDDRHRATTTTTSGAPPSTADQWLHRGHRGRAQDRQRAHRREDHPGQERDPTSTCSCNGDGEGGGAFIQDGSLIQIERVGTAPLLQRAQEVLGRATPRRRRPRRTAGKWLEISALDARFISFDQFLNAADLVVRRLPGPHDTAHRRAKPTTFAGPQGRRSSRTRSRPAARRRTGLMYIAAKGPPYVYKIVDDTPGEVGTHRLQPLRQGGPPHRPARAPSTSTLATGRPAGPT